MCLSGEDGFTMVFKLNEIVFGAFQLTSSDAIFNEDLLTSGGSLVTDKEELSMGEVLLVANG